MENNTSREIQSSMKEDIKTMKRIGRSIKHMKGKRGYVRVMYDPNRGLSEKKIQEKYGCNKVVVYNMEKVMNKNEFKYLSEDMKRLHLEAWRTRYTNGEIAEQMGMALPTFYNMIRRLGIVTEGKKKAPIRRKDNLNIESTSNGKIGTPKPKEKDTKEVEEEVKAEEVKVIDLGKINTPQEQEKECYKSFITLNETTHGDKIARRLGAIAELVDDEEEYIIELTIKRK